MSVSAAFTVAGNTVKVTAATSYPAAVQVPSSTGAGGNQYRILNAGSVTAFLGVGVFNPYHLLYSSCFALILFFTGLIIFHKVEKSFMDTV